MYIYTQNLSLLHTVCLHTILDNFSTPYFNTVYLHTIIVDFASIYIIDLFYSIPGFSESEEAFISQQLIQTYNDGDAEACRAVLKNPLIKFMDNAVSDNLINPSHLQTTLV